MTGAPAERALDATGATGSTAERAEVLCRAALGLCAAVAADPGAPAGVAVSGPDGYGRARVAAVLREVWAGAGARVLGAEELARTPDAPPAEVAVVVEEAQLLDAAATAAVARWAVRPGARVLVTHRSGPVPRELGDLLAVLHRRPLALAPLTRDELAAHLDRALGPATGGDAERRALLDVTERDLGGVPAWVEQAVAGWRADPAAREASARTGEAPERLTERLASALAAGVHEDDAQGPSSVLAVLAVGAAAGCAGFAAAALPALAPAPALVAASSSGLLGDDGALVPVAARAVASVLPEHLARAAGEQLLAEAVRRREAPAALALARELTSSPGRGAAPGAELGGLLLEASSAVVDTDPAAAAQIAAAARRAGADADLAAARGAEATALAGDSERALLLADEVLARAASADRAALERCVVVAATVLAHRALLPRSAELYRWARATGSPGSPGAGTGGGSPFAVLALVGTGDGDGARSALAACTPAPTLLGGACQLMAEGVVASVAPGRADEALGALSSASEVLATSARAALLPDTPAALAALVALHLGDPTGARAVLTRAVAGQQGGPAAQPRHRLLLAWAAMAADPGAPTTLAELAAARDAADRLAGWEPRDTLVALGLEAGLARRAGDRAAMAAAWGRARTELLSHPVDLYGLLPLGELVVVAWRLGEGERVQPWSDAALTLLDRLGRPALWTAPLLASRLQAALVAERDDEVRAAADALAALVGSEPGAGPAAAGALAAAGRQWVRVRAGEVDGDAVAAAARGLARTGHAWDASRLAGQAAVRTTDRRAMTSLLALARGLVASDDVPDSTGTATGAETPPAAVAGGDLPEAAGVLSGREREVAELVVEGRTYREVGARLFLSPKTVEHHVARMRQRLGAQDRSDLLERLRAVLAEPARR